MSNITQARSVLRELQLLSTGGCGEELNRVVKQFPGNLNIRRDRQGKIIFDAQAFLDAERRINQLMGFEIPRKDLKELVRSFDAAADVGATTDRRVPESINDIIVGLSVQVDTLYEEIRSSVNLSRVQKAVVRKSASTRARKAVLGTGIMTANGGAILLNVCESEHASTSVGMGLKYWLDAVAGV